ncbi:Chromosome partition protein Smc [Azospirillaceae bacterium]|nr:hypothetical protein MTCCP1_00044 [uncultured bacterium]
MTENNSRGNGGEVGLWVDLLGITQSRPPVTPTPVPADPEPVHFKRPDAGLPASRSTPFEEWIRQETAGGTDDTESPPFPPATLPPPETTPGPDPAALRAESLRYQGDIAAAGEELRRRRDEIGALERQHQALLIESTAMRERLARDQDSVGQLADERAALEYDLEGLRAELTARRAELIVTREAVQGRRAELDALERQAPDLAESVAAARSAQHQRDLLREETRGLELQLQALTDELAQLREERSRVQDDIQARRTEFAAIYNHDRKLLDKIKREIAIAQQQDKAKAEKYTLKPVR